MSESWPIIIGHRGAPGYRPEHTSASFELAIAQGVDAIEVDVVASADGVPVVRHERELSATTDVGGRPQFAARRREGVVDGRRHTGWFAEDFSWSEIRTLRPRERMPRLRITSAVHDGQGRVLRLSEVAAIAAAADVLLVVELKEAGRSSALGLPLPELVMTELATLGRPPAVVVKSFERTPLLQLRAAGAPWPIVYLLEDHGRPADAQADDRTYAEELADLAALEVFDGVSLPTTLISPARTDALHRAGLDVWTWTLRPENRFLAAPYRRGTAPWAHGDWVSAWSRLLDAGVDGLCADHPDLAIGLRETTRPLVGQA